MYRHLLATLTVAVASLVAQSNDPATPKVSVKFRALSFDEPILGAGFIVGRAPQRLDISNDFLSGEQTYRGLATIQFVMMPEVTKEVVEVPAEIIAVGGRRTAAQTRAQKASAEVARLSALASQVQNQAREGRASKASSAELAEAAAMQTKLSELSKIIADSNKEADDAQTELNNRQRDFQDARANAQAVKADETSKGKAPATAHKAQPKTPAAPAIPLKPLAAFTFPSDGKYILLFANAVNGKRIMAIEDKEGTFPFGSYLYINLTGAPVEIRYNGKPTPIATNGRAVINAPVANDTYAQGEIYTPGEDGYKIGYIARTYQQADVRTLFFLLPNHGAGHSINLKGIEERKPEEPVVDPNAGAAKGGKPSKAK